MDAHLKYAYALGIEKAAQEAGLSKEAFLASGAKALWGLGKGLWGATKAVGKPLWRTGASAIEKPVAGIGRRIGKHVLPHVPEKALPWVRAATSTIPREAGMFGLLGAGLGGAMAPEGERLKGAFKGLAGGVLGGAGWGAAKGLSRRALMQGMRPLVGSKGMTAVGRRLKTPLLKPKTEGLTGVALRRAQYGEALRDTAGKLPRGEWAKILGTKALLGGVPFAAGMGVSMNLPTFEEHPMGTLGAVGLGRSYMQGAALPPSLARRLPALGFTPGREMVY
jgi:hypothetical protein